MDFSLINHAAVLAAAVAAFAFGAVYYGLLAKPWMAAARIDPAKATMSPTLFATSFACELVMAWVLAGIIFHAAPAGANLWAGLVSGFLVWLGFMATTTAVNQRYEGFGWKLTLIDAGHWLGVALIMGGIIGWWGF